MSKGSEYQAKLRNLVDWDAYLLEESGLPGPRGNIELAQAVAREGNLALFQRYLEYDPVIAPVNSPYEFLAFCGALGLGRLLVEGEVTHLATLRELASDPRWRMREAVAMAMQQLGDVDMVKLIQVMQEWSLGSPLEQRAAAAALCEPRLLKNPDNAEKVLSILDVIMTSIEHLENRNGDGFIALRKGMGYCWSVATAALPIPGKSLMEKWLVKVDRDIQWIMQENLRKNRLVSMDPDWVARWRHTKT